MKRRLGSTGFSLLELLIGITILGIIAVPLLTAFVTTSSTSAKASRLRSQTIAAQNVAESVKAADVNAVLDDLKSGIPALTSLASSSGLYTANEDGSFAPVTDLSSYEDTGVYHAGFTGIAAGGQMYDAMVTLDATTYKKDTNPLNDTEIVHYKLMDIIFNQPNSGVEDPDGIAAADMVFQLTSDGYNLTDEDVISLMKRTVTITIAPVGGDDTTISCTAQYRYELVYQGKTYTASSTYSFYNGSFTPSNGVYFFFYPLHTSDVFNIENRGNLTVSFFLIKQGQPNLTYLPLINLKETYDSEKLDAHNLPIPNGSIYFNCDNTTAPLTFRYYAGHLFGSIYQDSLFQSKDFSVKLVNTTIPNRIYTLTVTLYRHGDDFNNPLMTFETSVDAGS
ncbi:prepilin-type N-terminal cleavage/methylation domain-containing protein [Oscillospiraceae bacterium WX1]